MKNAKYIVLGLMLGLTFSPLCANITFDGKQKLYFNAGTSWISYWNTSGAVFSAYFYNGSTNAFAGKAEQIDGNIYAVTVPAGTWSNVILTRHAPSTTIFDFEGGHGFWTQSQNISLNQYNWDNYISEFNEKGDGTDPYCEWNKLYSEQPRNGVTPAALAAYWGLTADHIAVCSNATGHPFTLTPNTYETGGGKYAYNYEMRAHAWFKTTDNGATWTNVDGLAGVRASADEGEMNWNNETVGTPGSVTYYYLYAKEANDQRLIEVTVDKDCEVSCEITSFEVTPTAVNVGDNTYTMDGIVAFTKSEGDLIIECDGKSVTIPSPESPQTFSLPGLTADGMAEDFRAYFSSMGSCEMHNYTTAPSPTTDATIHPQTDIAPKESTTLTPTANGTDPWEWTIQGDPAIIKNTGANTLDVPISTIDHDDELTYIYTEYNPLPTLPTNLMDNGSFEDVSVPFKWHTGYKNSNVLNSNKIWDGATPDKMNIYDLTSFKGQYGFFGVTNNANTYWKLMSQVAPRDGSYLAVIDGDEVADKQAWYASTVDNPNLKLMRGTTYLFSFWVANINNFGELVNNGRRNCGKLQFHIRCHSVEDDTWYEADLGDPIDLNEDKYMDFNWHQNSSTFSTREYFGKDFNADDVTISVVDKNNTGLTIGNDFALDDIQFKAVSVLSKSIKAREFFKVKIYETPTTVSAPVIEITQTPACGKTDFTMDVTVNYSTLNNKFPVTLQLTDNIYGDILPYPLPIDPATNPNSVNLTLPTALYTKLVADGKEHTLTAKITRIDGAGVDKGGSNSATYTSPGIPTIKEPVLTEQNKACDKTTFDLQVATEYLAFKGTKLHYEWDGTEWTDAENPSLSYQESTWQTATGKLKNLVADGNNHTLRVYSDNTTLDCEYTFAAVAAPYMPAVTVHAPEVQHYACGDGTYAVKVSASFTNGQMHDIIFKDWKTGTEQQVATSTNDGTAEYTFTGYAWDDEPAAHEYNVYFAGATSCDHKTSYTSPAQPALTVTPNIINTACDQTTYSLRLDLNYTNQRGANILANVDGGADNVKANAYIAQMSAATESIQIDGLVADGKTHRYNLQFDDAADCSKLDIEFPAPYSPQISAASAVVQPYACGESEYKVTVAADFANGQGHDLIIEDWNGNKETVHTETTDTHKEHTFAYAWETTVEHTYKVYFAGAESCADKHRPAFTAPREPKIENIAYAVTPAAECDKTTYDLKVTFDYYNQDGTLSVDVDGVAATAVTPLVANSADKQSATATFTALPADGGTHTITVKTTGGAHNCTATGTLTGVPHLPAISSVTPVIATDYACGDAQYSVTLTIAYANALGKDILVKEGSSVLKTVTANTGAGAFTEDVTLHFDFGTDHTLNVCFGNREDCAQEVTVTSPAQPALTVTPNIINTACDQTTYSLRLDLNYTNQRGANILANVDGGADNVKANAYIAQMSAATESIQIDGLVADGKTHRYNLQFDDAADCSKLDIEFPAPYSPQISAASAVVQPYACGESEYKVTVAADFANGQGHDLIIEDWNGNKETVHTETTDTHKEHTFAYAWETTVEHTYKVYFAGAESCADKHRPAFTAPREPKIENIAYAVTPAAECDKTTYDLKVTFDYYNQDGTLSVDVDGVAATAVTPLVANSADKQSATATFTALPADGGTHTITVKTTGGAHNCTATGTLTGVPHLPAISSVTPVIATDYACGDAQYSVTLTIAYANALGKDILVKEGSSVLKTVTANTGAGAFTEDITLDFDFGTDHTLNICFGNREDCAQKVTVTSPAQPALTVTPKVIHTDCEKNYDLDVEIKYTNQDGTLSVDVDGVAADPATLVFVPNSATGQTLTAKVKGLPADGGTHVLNVAFTGGIHSCAASPVDITAPLTSAVTSVSVGAVPLTVLCNETSYTVPVIVEMPYDPVIGKNLIVVHEGTSETVAITANPMTADIAMTTTDAAGLTIEAYIEGAPACKAVSAAFDAPARLSCVRDAATVCAGESYTWPHTGITYGPFATEGQDTVVNALNPGDSLFVTVLPLPQITLNAAGTVYEDDAEIRLPYTVTGGAPNLFNVTINSVASSHKRTTEDAIVITRPASVTAGDYTVTVDVLDTLTGCQSSAGIVVNVIERPVEPVIAIKNVVPSVPADCETTLSVTFDADYTNLPAAFTYWLDSDKAAEQTAAVVTGDKNARTVTGLTIGNIPADGKDHKIHVQFADTDNGKDSATFTTPLTHAIEAVTVSGVPATVLCNELPYFASVAVTLPYDTVGIKLVLHFEGRDTAVYTGAANPTNFILPMRTTNTTGLSVTARYCDAPACLITGNSFDAPTRLGCVKDYVDICEGESYTWQHNGVTYSPKTLGEHKYNEGFDSLFLTVRAQPAVKIYPSGRVCDDDAEVRWAYAVTQGTPDVFSVQIDGKDYDLTATAEELVLAMPAGLQPGDYTATFTIGDATISCTSTAQAEMTVAAGDLIYSKWSDLLFIDNSGKQFTAYQWYENGNILIDETRQYLFRTGGLPNEYFCRLTTTDGSTIYTCAKTFDEAIPSRTVTSEGGETTSVKMYDPVGRIVSGKLSNGIYIILEEVGGEKIVRKVAVFE